MAFHWIAASNWKLSPTYSFQRLRVHFDPASRAATTLGTFGNDPEHTFQLRSHWDVTRKTAFDQLVSWTSGLSFSTLPGHTRLDVRLGRRVGESVEIGVAGQNLLRPGTMEYLDVARLIATQARRSVHGEVVWRF